MYFITSRYFEYYQIKKTHHIISDISNPVNLQQYIDNRDGCKQVELKSFTYCWGWYNIHNEVIQKQGESPVRIPPGYYSFQQLADIFRDYKISMYVTEYNGRVSLSTTSGLKSFGDIVAVRFEHPEFKRLKNGAITELKLVVKDENNNVVDNNGLPMSCVLKII